MASPSPLMIRRAFAGVLGGAALLALGEGILASDQAHSQGSDLADTGVTPTQIEAAPQRAAASPAATPRSLDDLPWNLRLINGAHPLPDSFAPAELREIPDCGLAFDARAFDDLMALLDAANAAGVRPVVVSAYRSADYQADLFRRRVQRVEAEEGLTGAEAEVSAAFWVARPRTSEHEAAIAVDLADAAYQELDEAQEATATQRWLIDHCADYGFILRYPTDKSAVTGIGYEPWHYRYVGKEAAGEITASGLCLEEWIESCGWDTAA